MAKTLVLFFLLLQTTFFIAFAEELETLHHKPTAPLHPPTKSPIHKPLTSPPHHNHSPSHAPSHIHIPLHPPHPAKPPSNHHHQHQHHLPSPTPSHAHAPLHPRHPAKPPTHHHRHSPTHAPIKSPVHTPLLPTYPAKPPTHHHHLTPTHAPTHTPVVSKNLIAVEGVVYVKSCNHVGVDTLKGTTPLFGAVVKLQCNNNKSKLVLNAKTDKKDYFYIRSPKNITGYATRHCNVVLDSASNGLKPSNLHGGLTGVLLKSVKRSGSKGVSLKLYTVRPFAFEPKCHN